MEEIARALAFDKCVLFCGAGVTRDAGLPDWKRLVDGIISDLTASHNLAPTFRQSAEAFAQIPGHMADAVDLLINATSREAVTASVRRHLASDKPSAVCNQLSRLGFHGVVTTNFDRVVERIIVADARRLKNSLLDLGKVPRDVVEGHFLIKLHGDIDDYLDPIDTAVRDGGPFMVLGTSDYKSLVQGNRGERLRAALFSVQQTASILFIGYSFSDPEIPQLFDYLADNYQFAHQSWYVGLKGESAPRLPANVVAMAPISAWDELPNWLSGLEGSRKTARVDARRISPSPAQVVVSAEQRQAFVALSRYLDQLRSTDIAERVLACVLLEDITAKRDFDRVWVAERIRANLEIGYNWCLAFADSVTSYLANQGVIEETGIGHFRSASGRLQELTTVASAEFSGEREKFFRSVERRLSPDDAGHRLDAELKKYLDICVSELCIDFGETLAEWVFRGHGKDVALKAIDDILARHPTTTDRWRIAKGVLELVFTSPADDEVEYVSRLLTASFLASSVRLDPETARSIKTLLAAYELYLDSSVLLPLVIREHEDHDWLSAMVNATHRAGVKICVLNPMLQEVRAHRLVAQRDFDGEQGDLEKLGLYVDIQGKTANCYVQGYVRQYRFREGQTARDVEDSSSEVGRAAWNSYLAQYSDAHIQEIVRGLGIEVVNCTKDDKPTDRYADVLQAITEEWTKKRAYYRAQVLNENEALQFLHIYHRRREMQNLGDAPEAWFLSNETVLEKVFVRASTRWGTPPTFPVSAWAGFVNSGIGWGDANRRLIVDAVAKGRSSAFALPDARDIIQKRAFGSRVPTLVEEQALEASLSDFVRGKKLDQALDDIRTRHYETGPAKGVREMIGEIDYRLNREIEHLRSSLEQETAKRNTAEEQLKDLRNTRIQKTKPKPALLGPTSQPGKPIDRPFKKRRR